MNKLFLLAFLMTSPLWAQNEEVSSVTEPSESIETSDALTEVTPAPQITEEKAALPTPPEDSPQPMINTETPTVTTEIPVEEKDFNSRESHWFNVFGFESLKYRAPFDFVGVEKTLTARDQELWGGRLGFGGEIYLGLGLVTTTKVEGYYVGTLFSQVLNAGPDDVDEEFAFSKKTGQVFGVDATQTLGFMFEMKTKNPFLDEWSYLMVEPYAEFGVGRGWAQSRVNYHYDTGPTGTQEDYRQTMRDDLVNTRVGGGINFTSRSGYFLFLKTYVNRFDVTQRKIRTYEKPDGGSATTSSDTDKDVKIKPITTFALGGGYKF